MSSFANSIDQSGVWVDDLPRYANAQINQMVANGLSLDQIALLWLERIGSSSTAPFGAPSSPPTFTTALKREFDKFICGDKAYTKARPDFVAEMGIGRLAAINLLAGVLATPFGASAVAISPAIAIFLTLATQMTTAAYCQSVGAPPASPTA